MLNYLEKVPESESLWHGECFVFDQRVSVGHGLKQGDFDLCHACRVPLTTEDKASPLFEDGVSCPACHDVRTEASAPVTVSGIASKVWQRPRGSSISARGGSSVPRCGGYHRTIARAASPHLLLLPCTVLYSFINYEAVGVLNVRT